MNNLRALHKISKSKVDSECKVLIAYHAHCIDGYTSAWACWKGLIATTSVISNNIEFAEMVYGKLDCILKQADKYDRIYFVDFSVPLGVLAELSVHTNVTIIDHHKTAIDIYGTFTGTALSSKVEIVLDISQCGASLTWLYFFGNDKPVPKLITYVRDYDLWEFMLNGTRGVNKYLRLQDNSIPVWNRLEAAFNSIPDFSKILTTGMQLQQYHSSVVNSLVGDASEICHINGERGIACNCPPQFASDVGHSLANVSGTYGATWQQVPGGEVKWSLRSNGDYDVSKIAAAFGGGGHKNAAGFTLVAPTDDMSKLGVTLWSSKSE